MTIRISQQPIPSLSPHDPAWSWTVSDGQFIVGRFCDRGYAEIFRDALIGSGTQSLSEASTDSEQERSAEDDPSAPPPSDDTRGTE